MGKRKLFLSYDYLERGRWIILSHAYVHATLLTNIGIFMGNSSYNNTETGMVSGESSMEPTSA